MPTRQSITRTVALGTIALAALAAPARAADNEASKVKERELIKTVQSGQPAEKALACKGLAVYGSKDAVPALAPLLADEQLASWARIALEAIPGPEADEALRKAAETLHGKLLVGTLNSIGVRRDASAVEPLARHLKNKDADAASAAAVALGHIGNADATTTLRQALAAAPPAVRSAVAEGCVLCAERLIADGKSAEAAQLYDEIRKADVPKQRKLEATRGAILARKADGIPILVEQLRSRDKAFFQLGLFTAREMSGAAVAKALDGELAQSTPDRAALLLAALADRNDATLSPAVLSALKNGSKPVRIAAMGVVRHAGDASNAGALLDLGVQSDAELADAAKAALAKLPGEQVDALVRSRLANADGKLLGLLISLVGERRIEATPDLVKALGNSDPAIRAAALAALGATVSPKELSVLLTAAVASKNPADAEAAQKALRQAAIRMPDREVCAAELASAVSRAPIATKVVLLNILGDVSGKNALEAIGAAAKTGDPQLLEASTKLLGAWMSVDAAPLLLDLAKTASGDKYQVRALRGYIRLVRQFTIPENERLAMCQKAFDAASRTDEQKLVLEVLARYPSTDALNLAVKAGKVPALGADSTRAILLIAHKLGPAAPGVHDQLAALGLDNLKVEIVKAHYGSEKNKKDVTETLRRGVGPLPVFAVPKGGYITMFGGDPNPFAAKQLTVEYRINGKPGEATFPDNAVIVLPVPK